MEQILSEANNLVISIDAMGGDNSPRVVIEGLALAAKKNPDAKAMKRKFWNISIIIPI